MRSITAVLLIVAVLFSFAVPFDITVLAEEEPARGSEIHAVLYYINGSSSTTQNLELVFQRGSDEDSNKSVFAHYMDFADTSGTTKPWSSYSNDIVKVDIKDKIAPTNMGGWFNRMMNLTDDKFTNLQNIDTSNVTNMDFTFENLRKITRLDLSSFDVSKVTRMQETFCSNYALTELNISTWNMKNVNYCPSFFSGCNMLEEIDLSGLDMTKAQYMVGMFSGCTKLKSIRLGKLSTTYSAQLASLFKNCSSLEEVDLSQWNVSNPGTFMEMFSGCTSLKSVNFGSPDHWGPTPKNWTYNGWYERAYQLMFYNCASLETLDLTCVKGALICDSMFKDCVSLKELNLGYAGVGQGNTLPDLTGKPNIFDGCNELSCITLSAEGWPAAGKAGTSIPVKGTWKKIDGGTALCPVGTLKSNTDLFGQFQPEYAGTWAAEAAITMKGNGGSPSFQTISGIKGEALVFDENEIVAERTGYDFDGWWTDKTEGTRFHSGDTAEQWNYYAHWIEHKYNLVIDGNGGTVPASFTSDDVLGGTISEDRTKITFSNLNYSEFQELNGDLFAKEGKSRLTSWNTRVNGAGDSYFVSDSVNKLTPTDGETVTLFAQWDDPDYVVMFDSQGGTEISKRFYGQSQRYGDLSKPEKPGYTFQGWFTAAEGGTKITSSTRVTADTTLYAHWKENPIITLNANGGKFSDNSTEKTLVYSDGQNLGVLPTPEWGTRVFKGWYQDAVSSDNGTVSPVTESRTYYAHWGYQPTFETNGGNFTDYDPQKYPVEDGYLYTINELPEAEYPEYTFAGWYFQYEENGEQKESSVTEGTQLDLRKGYVIKAKWTPNTPTEDGYYTVTLDANGGTALRNKIKVYGGHYLNELPTPTKTGCNFLGWFDSNGVQYTYNNRPVNSNLTLTAHWEEKDISVHFNPNGGTLYDSTESTVNVPSGDTLSSIPGANRENFSFDGWYPNIDGTGEKLTINSYDEQGHLISGTVFTEDKTYYAKWVNREQVYGNYRCLAQWDTKSNNEVTNDGDQLVFHPTKEGNISAHLYIRLARVDSGIPTKAGAVRIVVPQKVFLNSQGNGVGISNIEQINRTVFSLTSDGNGNYIISNIDDLTQDFDFDFHYTVNPNQVEGGYTDERGYFMPEFFHNDFDVTVQVDNDLNGSYEVDYSRHLGLEVHTDVDADATKTQANVSLDWDEVAWQQPAPADADEYYYVTWELNSKFTNRNQPYSVKWSEDTVHDGLIVYSEGLDAWSQMGTPDKVSAKIVTKHRRDSVRRDGTNWVSVTNEAILSVKLQSGYIKNYRPNATAYAYIEDGTAPSLITKTIPNYTTESKHSKPGGQEFILNTYFPDDFYFLYDITYKGKEGVGEPVWNAVSGTYDIKERTMLISDGEKGDVLISSDTGSNKYKWDSSTNQNLAYGDYYFESISISLTEYDAVCMNGNWSNPFKHATLDDYGEIIVRVRTTSNNNLEVYQTKSGVDNWNVTLPDGTYYYEIEHKSSFYTSDIAIRAKMQLNPFSNRLKSIVSDDVVNGCETLIKNKSKLKVAVSGGETNIYDTAALSPNNEAWPCIYKLGISKSTICAAKNCSSMGKVMTYDASSTEEFPVVIGGWNYNNSANSGGNKKIIASGVFYDLLPPESTVDKSTVFVKPRLTNSLPTSFGVTADNYENQKKSGLLPSGLYSVNFIENYENSGRTMMIVRVSAPEVEVWDYNNKPVGFNVFYMLKTTYANVNRNGQQQWNAVSFTDTTEKQSTPSYKNGSINELDTASRTYFQSIDSDQTAFAAAKTNMKVLPDYIYGLNSLVHAENSNLTKHEIVGLNSKYSYYITFGDNNKTKDLVLYDVIEKRMDGLPSEWTGEFLSIDVSQIGTVASAEGTTGNCAPKVRYSVMDKSLFTSRDNLNIDDDTVWQDEPPADLSTVTAVAVDCRKTTTGDDFILPLKKELGFHINMLSPKDNVESESITRNEAVVKGLINDNNHSLIQNTYTDVIIRYAYPKIVKESFPTSGESDAKRAGVVMNSVLNYTLNISNPDEVVPVKNVVVEDFFDNTLKLNNKITVQIGNSEPVEISKAAHISSYSTKAVSGENKVKFTATIDNIDPGETVSISIPVTVSSGIGTKIDNTAQITSSNGVVYPTPVESNTTYHIVTGTKAKILKVNEGGKPLAGATLQILKDGAPIELKEGNTVYGTEYVTGQEVRTFDISPGEYTLHEVNAPENFNASSDIWFRVDAEGISYIRKNNKETAVSYVEMTDTAKYKVIFHENNPEISDKDVVFRTYEPNELNEDKSITHFYDIPAWAGDEYVFMGWYHDAGYTKSAGSANLPLDFDSNTADRAKFVFRSSGDYHLYAKWIKVGTVDKAAEDTNIISGYRGFGLAGVQLRDENMYDPNIRDEHGTQYNDSAQIVPSGMRYVASVKETLLSAIKGIDKIPAALPEAKTFGVEYGYAVGTENNINQFIDHYKITDTASYRLQYKGSNVNGVNTDPAQNERTAQNDFRYIKNLNCTSREGATSDTGIVMRDHRNFSEYRLYTLVVTYEGQPASTKDERVDARAYMRYYDANGKLRVFYNDYKNQRGKTYYGGCMCSFNQLSQLALPSQPSA